ncbi:MAG TPA: FAD binding domain-containing protein [Acidimicrobiia bacterium]|nr:FAD binding domain-containing protein [Acidimicrobiia bacterium]
METHHPASLSDALDALDADPEATILAGGTDLMVSVNYDSLRPSSVIAIRRVRELHEWDGRFIGAGVTFARMENGPIRALAQAARTVGSPQIRNAGTLGGNLGTASPAGDSLPVLAALDAEIVVTSKGGERSVHWDEFVTGPKRTALEPGELIVGSRLPERIPPGQAFAKIGIRNAMVIAITSCCLFRDEDGRTTVALGSVGPTPIRARRAEEMISDEPSPSPAAIEEFGRLVAEEVSPIDDHRSTAAYRRHASGVLAKRLLARVLTR